MQKKVTVTIGREYGSGGREVGEKLAERLGFTLSLIHIWSQRIGTALRSF